MTTYLRKKSCPKCKSNHARKDSLIKNRQNFKCLNCSCRFVKQSKKWIELAYKDYTTGKQNYSELSTKYNKSEKTLRKYFDKLKKYKNFGKPKTKQINLTIDTTFFKGKEGFGVVVFRADKKNIYWDYCETEKLSEYQQGF